MVTGNQNKVQPEWATVVKNEISGAKRMREGDVVEAEFIKKTPRAAFFDLGKFGIGIVYGLELANAKSILKNLNPGDKLPARIETLEGESGYAELSLAKAGRQKLWEKIQELQESGEIVKAKINGANAGGLTVDVFGLKAFLPASQLSAEHYPQETEGDREKNIEAMRKLIGQEISIKIISLNPRMQKIVVSERETAGANLKELVARYEIGQTVDGLVSGIADFGVFVRFVDNPQIEGLIHISEIDHRLIDNPKEVIQLNEQVQAKIIDIRDGRIFLSLKALKPDPWQTVKERYQTGQEISGRVYKFNPFGAVVDLENGLQGMLHVAEFGGVEEMKNALIPGQNYKFIIELIKPEDRRLILKLKE